jgi:hypothetical protein
MHFLTALRKGNLTTSLVLNNQCRKVLVHPAAGYAKGRDSKSLAYPGAQFI